MIKLVIGKAEYKKFLLLLAAILIGYVSFAIDNTKIIHYTDKEGLPLNIVSSFVIDKYGYGWAGTGNVIARFDGYRFITCDLFKIRNISGLVLDNKNHLWLGSYNGLFLYNRFSNFFTIIKESYTKHLTSFINEIYYMKAKKLVERDRSFNIDTSNISIGLNNTIWISTHGSGLICLLSTNKTFTNITPKPGNSNSLIDKEGISVFVDNDSFF